MNLLKLMGGPSRRVTLQRNLYLGYSLGNGAPDSPLTDLRIEANGFATLTPRNHGLAQADQIRWRANRYEIIAFPRWRQGLGDGSILNAVGGRPRSLGPVGPAWIVLFSLVAMGLAVAAVRLGLWGQGWGLPSRSTYAAQIAALLTAQWSGMPAAALGAWLLWRGRLRATMPPLQALPRYRPSLDRLTRLLTLVIDVAVVLNGLPFWARPRWIGWPRRFVLGKFGVCFRPAAPTD